MEVAGTANPRDFTTLGEFGGDRDRIRGFAAAIQLQDGGVDRLVRRSVEVRVTNEFDDISYRVFTQQHCSEDRLFGGRVIGWGPVRLPRLLIGERELRNAHLCAPSSAPHNIIMRQSQPCVPRTCDSAARSTATVRMRRTYVHVHCRQLCALPADNRREVEDNVGTIWGWSHEFLSTDKDVSVIFLPQPGDEHFPRV